MRVVFAGQTGVQKGEAIAKLARYACEQSGVPTEMASQYVSHVSVEEELKKDGDFTGFLNTYNDKAQSDRWLAAFDRVLQSIEQLKPKHVFLSMHAVFQRHSRFFSPVSWDKLREFRPDLFVTLIDDIQSIWRRVTWREEKSPTASYFRLREIATWRSAEILFTDTLAQHLVPGVALHNRVVAVKHPCPMLHRLLFDPHRLVVYASFPITSTRVDDGKRAEVDSFRSALHGDFTVFDPLTIDEKPLELALREQFPEWAADPRFPLAGKTVKLEEVHRWPIDSSQSTSCDAPGAYPMELDAVEVREVAADVNNQIRLRDYRLISQASCVAAYRPMYGGEFSGGVHAELNYAANVAQIPTFLVFPDMDGDPNSSPFSDMGKVCADTAALLEALGKHQDPQS